jgi:hypothetical protein
MFYSFIILFISQSFAVTFGTLHCEQEFPNNRECQQIDQVLKSVETRNHIACKKTDAQIECLAQITPQLQLSESDSVIRLVDIATRAAATDALGMGCKQKPCAHTLVSALLDLSNKQVATESARIKILNMAYASLIDMHASLPNCGESCSKAELSRMSNYTDLNKKYLSALKNK